MLEDGYETIGYARYAPTVNAHGLEMIVKQSKLVATNKRSFCTYAYESHHNEKK